MADHLIDRYLAARDRAVAAGDRQLVREIDANLDRIGYRPNLTAAELIRAESAAEAGVRPARGVPPTRRAV